MGGLLQTEAGPVLDKIYDHSVFPYGTKKVDAAALQPVDCHQGNWLARQIFWSVSGVWNAGLNHRRGYSEKTNCAIHFLLLRVLLHTGEPPRPVRHHYLEPGPLSRLTRFADGDPGNI